MKPNKQHYRVDRPTIEDIAGDGRDGDLVITDNLKPSWYFQRLTGGWRFYCGKTLDHWTLNIGTPWFDCGYGY